MAKLQIVIVGAGGFAREVACLLPGFLDGRPYDIKGFLGRDHGVPSPVDLSPQWLGDPEEYEPDDEDRFVLAIGNMPARRRVMESLMSKGAQFLTLCHRLALVAPTAQLAEGVLIYPFACVSNNAWLELGVKLNYYASVGHDTRLGRFCLLAPYATVNGFAILEDEVYLSTHSTVAPQVRVGCRAKLSANSSAMRDVPNDHLAFGVPARVVRRMDI